MRVNIDQSQTQGVGSAIPMYDPQDMLNEIKSEIVTVRENLATRDTDVGETTKTELAISDSFTSALAITSNLFAVILSGTMIMSAHKLARQARNITTVARKFEFDVPLREHLVDQRSVDTGRSVRKDRDFGKSCSSAFANAVDLGRSASGSKARTHQGKIYKTPPATLPRLRDERASKIQDTEPQDKVTSGDCSTSNDDNPIQTSAAGQSESCADQQSWDGIWNSSTRANRRRGKATGCPRLRQKGIQ